MTPDYEALGLDCAIDQFGHRGGDFARELRELEINAPRVNLSSDVVHFAAEIAALEPGLDGNQRLALIVLVLAVLAALEDGSTRLPVSGALSIEPMKRLVGALIPDSQHCETMISSISELIESGATSNVIGGEGDFRPLIYHAPWLAQHRVHVAESKLAAGLAALIESDRETVPANNLDEVIKDLRARPSVRAGQLVELSAQQIDALRLATRAHLSVISGGPGTGKTSIVVAIVRALVRLGVEPDEIALAAPTGKAAYRMREAIIEGLASLSDPAPADTQLAKAGPDASTIHRLLGYSPESGRFRHHRNNPLSASVVIVDEASMIDVVTMERLVGALRQNARLVVMGDADQLPSISAGAVLRDLAGLKDRRVLLTHNYRARGDDPAARAIRSVAAAIRDGAADALSGAPDDGAPAVIRRDSADAVAFAGVELLPQRAGNLAAFLARWHRERLFGAHDLERLLKRDFEEQSEGFVGDDLEDLRRAFEWASRSRLLCATRLFTTGVERINAWMHAQTLAHGSRLRGRFVAGEPLLVLRNDYERGLFNGDQGLVLKVKRGGASKPGAVFARGTNFAAFELDTLAGQIEHCYAMTVHKAQGSEFDSVALIAPDRDLAMFTREILYTALTRSGKSIVLVGDEARLAGAIQRTAQRYSGLAESLGSSGS